MLFFLFKYGNTENASEFLKYFPFSFINGNEKSKYFEILNKSGLDIKSDEKKYFILYVNSIFTKTFCIL